MKLEFRLSLDLSVSSYWLDIVLVRSLFVQRKLSLFSFIMCAVSTKTRSRAGVPAVQCEWSKYFVVSLFTHASTAGCPVLRQAHTTYTDYQTPISFLQFYPFLEMTTFYDLCLFFDIVVWFGLYI